VWHWPGKDLGRGFIKLGWNGGYKEGSLFGITLFFKFPSYFRENGVDIGLYNGFG